MARIVVLGSHAESLVIFRFDMLQALARQHEVIACIPPAAEHAANQQVQEKLQTLGITVKHVSLKRTGLNPFDDLKSIYNLYKVFKQLQPDVLFAYTAKPVVFGSIAGKMARVPRIYSMITGLGSYFIHNDLKSKCVCDVMSGLYQIGLLFNAKVFFQNNDDVAEFAQRRIFNDPARTVVTNGSGVNLDYFQYLPHATTKITFLLTARFIVDKGILEYLQAAEQIKQQYPHVEFLLVGWFDGKESAIAPETIQKYVNKGIVQYLGKRDDVRPALAQANVFVLPSYREGTPKTVLEAMACGRAIIATDVPGCRETVVHGENGFLIPARNVASLRDAMEKFIINPTLAVDMGKRSRMIAEHKFDVKQVNQILLNAMELVDAAVY